MTGVSTGKKTFECEVCEVTFYYSSDLNRHVTVHIGEKPFECDVCGMNFSGSFDLKEHVGIVHT